MVAAGAPFASAATEAGTWTNPLFAQDAEAQGSSSHDVDIFSSARTSRVYKIKSLGDIVRKLGKVREHMSPLHLFRFMLDCKYTYQHGIAEEMIMLCRIHQDIL
jgi:hypothetical protein